MTSAWGGRQPRRIDQRPRQKSAAGSGPAPSSAIIIARVIIVKGSAGGVFIYDSAGNLIDSIAFHANVDPLTHSNDPGIVNRSNVPVSGQFQEIQINAGIISFLTSITQSGPYSALAGTLGTKLYSGSAGSAQLLAVTGGLTLASSPGGSGGLVFMNPTGVAAADTLALQINLGAGLTPVLLPGTWTLTGTLNCTGNQGVLAVPGAIVQPNTPLANGMINISAANNLVQGIQFKGNGQAADAIQIAAGANRYTIRDIIADTVDGLIVNIPGSTGANHGVISGVLGTNCNGGIGAVFAAGSRTLQLSIAQCNIQQCQTAPALAVNGLTDIAVDDLDAAVSGGAGVPTVQINGPAASVYLVNCDLGQFPNTGGNTPTQPTILIADSSGSPNDINIISGVIQQGVVGVRITGGANRVTLDDVRLAFNQGAGLDDQGTGFGHDIDGCKFTSNGQAAGAAADITWSGTAAGRVHHNRFDTPQGAASGQVANVATFTGGGTQIFDDNWIGGSGFTAANVFGTAPSQASRNQGFNPVDSNIPLGTPGVPASGSSTGPRAVDCQVAMTTAASTVAVSVGGVALATFPASSIVTFRVPRTQAVTLTYVNAPTWVWIGE